ncbi:MAG: efflux RND transporter permease subunit [Nannocystaceae bacterium]
MSGGFIRGTILRPVTTTMVTIAIMVFGLVALTRLPVSLLPNLSYPSITVQTEYPDAAPSEVEELITRPVEELVGAVPGVVRVESTSREGKSEVVLDFAWGTGMDRAMDDVREKLDRIVQPQGAERPVVLRYDPSQEPILRLALVANHASDSETAAAQARAQTSAGTGDEDGSSKRTTDLALLRRHAELQVKRSLEKVPGVAAVQLHGGDEEEVLVELDPARLAALRVTDDEIITAIQTDNINRPGGALTQRRDRYLIRTVHEARTPEQIGEIIVRSINGAELRVRDLATVRRAPKEREELSLLGGSEAVELAVYREGDANTVAVANEVVAAVEQAGAGNGLITLPEGESLEVLSNQAAFIESAIREVRDNTLLGGVLAVLVLLFFLRDLRATLVIATTIPISLLATFVPLQQLGVSLNLMSLGGLALGVGMLVDNAIVVLEAIARVRETRDPDNLDPKLSATVGTAEVAPSVVASTLTTVAVFLPMAFVEGVAGQLVRDLSYAVSFSILSSMVVSLTLVPVLQSLGGGKASDPQTAPKSLLAWLAIVPALVFRLVRILVAAIGTVLGVAARPLTWLYEQVEGAYPRFLRVALRLRHVVVLASIALCVYCVGLSDNLGRTLIPEVAQGEFYVQVSLPQGSSLERTTHLARRVMAAAEGDPAVAQVFARVGSMTAGNSATGSVTGTHLTQINVRLAPGLDEHQALVAEQQLFARMEAATYDPEATVRLGRPELFSFDAPIEVQVFSEDLPKAVEHARTLIPALTQVPGIVDIAPDDLAGRPEVRVDFDRERLSKLGLGVETAATAVQRSIQGELTTKMYTTDRQLDVRVQLPKVHRSKIEDVARIQVGVVGEVPVTLGAVASLAPAIGPAEIRRMDGRRGLRIRARLDSSNLAGVASEVKVVLDEHATDPKFTAEIAGQAQEMGSSLDSLLFTGLISLFLIYVVMASSFESLHHPFLIMLTVPLSIVGVIVACVVTQTPISAMVGIGAIILGGIVVNNAIVLINTVNHRRGLGMDVGEALVTAGHLRVRPILMTTATTVLGLLPMALGFGDGAALRQPLAIAVIGGLTLATALTLLVIPCCYLLMPGRKRDAWANQIE